MTYLKCQPINSYLLLGHFFVFFIYKVSSFIVAFYDSYYVFGLFLLEFSAFYMDIVEQ